MSDKYVLPIPMITVLQHGKSFNGKQNLIKEFILMPKNNLKEVGTFFLNHIHFD